MKLVHPQKWLLVLLTAGLLCSTAAAQQRLVICGDDRVSIVEVAGSDSLQAKSIWDWRVSEVTGIPEVYQKLLVPLDECKSVDNGSKLLLTSSGGAVILLDTASRQVLFYAKVPMAHSAAVLPGNLVAVALSTHREGNSLELYRRDHPEQCLWRDTLYSGHGVVWDSAANRLYALGYDVLRAYQLVSAGNPSLKLQQSWKLPTAGGHDLTPIGADALLISTHEQVFRFDKNKGLFQVFNPLRDRHNIKSANYNPTNRRLVYTQATESWWTHHINLNAPPYKIPVPDIRLYKVRVMQW